MPQVEKETLLRLLTLIMPDIHEELAKIDKNRGWIKLPEEAINFIIQWKFHWHQLYENEQLLKAIGSTMFLENEEAKDLFDNTPKDDVYQKYGDFFESIDKLPTPTDTDKFDFLDQLNSSTEEEQKELLKPICKMVIGLLSVTFNYLALMIHGRTMCQLVTDAKNGDDNAYRCAVQIDRSVLRLEYFQERLLRAQFSGDQDFLDKLGYRIKAPVIQTKIRYKTLLFTFAILEDEGYLSELTHDELFDVCENKTYRVTKHIGSGPELRNFSS